MNDRAVVLCSSLFTLVMTLAGAAVAAADPPLPGRPIDARTAVARALGNNASLQATDLGLADARQAVTAEEGRYPFVFHADAGYTRSRNPRLGPDDSVSTSGSTSIAAGTALSRTFATGTSASVRVQGERFQNDSITGFTGSGTGAGYTARGRVSVVQPLLRGFGTEVGEADLRTARLGRKVAEKAQERAESTLARDVLGAYLELWFAAEAERIDRSTLTLAERQRDEAAIQVEAGAISQSALLSFETRAAELEESVVGADAERRQRSLALSELMGDSSAADGDTLVASAPLDESGTASRTLIEAALREGSVELAELEARVEVARARLKTAGEASRARLDLEGFVETAGVSEGAGRAFGRAGELGWVTTHLGATFELPLTDTRKDAEQARAVLAVRIAEQNLRAARDRIAADASFAVTTEESARKRLELAKRTLETAERNHEAERARFELGSSIPIQVQEAEDGVRRARLRVARAEIDLAMARVNVKHLTGELLAAYGRGAARPR